MMIDDDNRPGSFVYEINIFKLYIFYFKQQLTLDKYYYVEFTFKHHAFPLFHISC